jgi:C-terminal processing protease CtpA/Prc
MLAALDLDGKPLEGIGVTPDIEVRLDLQAWNKGAGPDSQLDRAIEYIVNGK